MSGHFGDGTLVAFQIQIAYMTGTAYIGALVVYQVGHALGY